MHGDYSKMVDVLDQLPQLVRTAREKRQLSQYDAATEIGVHLGHLNRIERDKAGQVNAATLRKILVWLAGNLPPDWHEGVVFGIRHPGAGPVGCPYCIETLRGPS